MLTSRELIRWAALDDRRRRQARTGLGGLSPWIWSSMAGLLLFAESARELASGAPASSASRLLVAVILATHVVVMFGASFRMYWRRDSAMLARLPIPGRPLFDLALFRSLRATALVSLPCAGGVAAMALLADPLLALRHLALLVIAALGAALFAPAAALAAGGVVASETARSALSSLAGDFEAPRTSYLGLIPGLAATMVALLIVSATGWAGGAESTAVGPAGVLLGGAAGVFLLAAALAMARAAAVMPAAVREVAALDQERLAHVERTEPSFLERAFARLARGVGARLVFEKDVSLARRRYPIPYFVGLMALIVLWILAVAAPSEALLWAGLLLGSLGAYAVVMAKRLLVPPIEHPRVLASLPFEKGAAASAKRAQMIAWVATYMLLGGLPLALRAPRPLLAIAVVIGIAAVTFLACAVIVREPARAQ